MSKYADTVKKTRTCYTLVKNKKGITLVALIVTIIILLILAGVTINLTLGNHGILKMAEKAVKDYQNSAEKETNELKQLENYININKILAEKVSFTPTDINWNVSNVKEALDYLFNN